MFRQLKLRILWTNLIILTILVFITFSSTYMLTYKLIYDGIEKELHRISETRPKVDDQGREQPPEPPFSEPNPERMAVFKLTASPKGDLIRSDAFFDADMAFFEAIKDLAMTQESTKGILSYEGNKWAFIYKEVNGMLDYTFIDVSAQVTLLENMVYVFFGVFLGSVVLVVLISNYLTSTATKPIRDAFDRQKQFVSDASHELKTPIAIIQTTTDLLVSEARTTPQGDSHSLVWLENIKAETEKMGRLTKDLLYLAQIDHRENSLGRLADFDMSECIEAIALSMEVLAFEKQLNFDYESEKGLWIHGNREQLTETVRILLDNAIRYTDSGGRIKLTFVKSGMNCELAIENTGEGITAEHLPHLFDRFYRIDQSRNRESQSHGLGLAIAKEIVEQHDGKLGCSSEPGISTKFTVKLPSVAGKSSN
ncbi:MULTISPECIES: cell wall metabolism sensor histidine kinase WalK [unclassified Fusibacter]|uniref:sensor histidine kinase n=1 Tax=unclassified Fusibacter TaxID=2624464 RepID=UPI0013E8FBC8|nr:MULTISPECIES: HAMP domain-containing sensor histidine kinase [unclassified Fusibacter]MCK8060199.1 HAMP domain-containing histidine kinase [Fusibacter sp. A2]NPE22339.1 GHKL domain-containing protein [Fusibacter sp. A1]